ncbi:helix-turn-helix domain-containing protein [Planomonospora venezuelensis]|uniref:Transcriptional regulator with XRE-family HTH domain n=1 Tax=Planomonospora venezuelensis TaxID=1999 RepID=A0A841CXM0_PLAVE|nr:helix-turn-helix domain-containing protein [Planomonospora venezuelensis]MBB5961064.1 transcriptional regulator with XRE-family HTH domain [Planomonospora venezuelensis]
MDTDTSAVGRRIRRLREERGISLSELARRAGVGKATLSGLENGTRNPTLETLWAVTAQLGVGLAAVVDTGPVVHGTAVQGVLLQAFEEEGATYELYRLVFPAGSSQTSPAHPEGVTEHLTVFAGTLRAGPADAPLTAGPGEYVTWRSDVPHTYAALGDHDVHAGLLIRYPRRGGRRGTPDGPAARTRDPGPRGGGAPS